MVQNNVDFSLKNSLRVLLKVAVITFTCIIPISTFGHLEKHIFKRGFLNPDLHNFISDLVKCSYYLWRYAFSTIAIYPVIYICFQQTFFAKIT